jgi:site-specific DNA-methyltransferase (adenine-specific)
MPSFEETSGQVVPKPEADNIYLTDGIEGLLALPQGSVDMLLTDPPYGTTKNYWDTPLPLPEFWAAVKHAVKPDGAILIFAQCPYDKILGASNLAMLRYEWVWCKDRITGFLNARRMPLKKSENILVFYRKLPKYNPQFGYGKPYTHNERTHTSENYGKWVLSGGSSPDGRRFPCNVISFNTVQGGIHPTQKPSELCEYLIKTYTDGGDLVADVCAGSGTTAIACIRTGRRFICFENAPKYYALAAERIRRELERT